MRRCRAKAAVAERVAAAPWSLLVAIALTGSSPARSRAGMVNTPPPPAMESKQPATAATANRAVRPPRSNTSGREVRLLGVAGLAEVCLAVANRGRFAMAAPIALRADFDGPGLRRGAKGTKDAAQARRLLALAEIYDGGSRTDAARIGGVTLQIVRDWVLRFNKHGPEGLINGKAPGNRPKLNEDQRQALARMVESGPIPAVHGVVRWRRKDLARWLFEEFQLSVDETTVGRALLQSWGLAEEAPWQGPDQAAIPNRPATKAA